MPNLREVAAEPHDADKLEEDSDGETDPLIRLRNAADPEVLRARMSSTPSVEAAARVLEPQLKDARSPGFLERVRGLLRVG